MTKDYYDVRAVFSKTDRAVYISHLDLMRLMQRTFKRARLPVWFTKGYNPHIYLLFHLPLSLGVASRCEIMDFGMDILGGEPGYEDIKRRMNAVLPEGIRILELRSPVMRHTEIGSCTYTAEFYSDRPPAEIKKLFESFISQDKIIIEKRCKVNMKKTVLPVDIKPDIELMSVSEGERSLDIGLRLPAGINKSLNVVSVTSAFESFCGFEFDRLCINRTKILSINGEDFK